MVLQNQPYFSRFMEGEAEFRAATRKERRCFAPECGLGRLGHTGTPDGLEQPHEKNGPVLLQNVAPTPLGTHEHSRVHFSIRRLRTQFTAATRKERPCFAAECGFGRLGHTGTLEALEQPHEKNGPVLLGPFFDPKTQNPKARSPEGFRGATRKERRGPGDWHLGQAKMHIL